MPRFPLFFNDPDLGVHSSVSHFIPWVRRTGSSGFWTRTDKKHFTANVSGPFSRTIGIVRDMGSTLKIREWEWEECMVDYIGMQSPVSNGYRKFSRAHRFIGPMLEEFFPHMFNPGNCVCITPETGIPPAPAGIRIEVNPWEV